MFGLTFCYYCKLLFAFIIQIFELVPFVCDNLFWYFSITISSLYVSIAMIYLSILREHSICEIWLYLKQKWRSIYAKSRCQRQTVIENILRSIFFFCTGRCYSSHIYEQIWPIQIIKFNSVYQVKQLTAFV